MPQIDIKEIDNTTDGAVEAEDIVVLVPGYTNGETGIKLYTDEKAFLDDVKPEDEEESKVKVTAEYARLLLTQNVGVKVLYNALAKPEGDELDINAFIKEYEQFEDKGKYNIRFITKGNFTIPTDEDRAKVDAAMIRCAAIRGDACAIIDADKTDTKEIIKYLSDTLGTKTLGTDYPDTVTRRDGTTKESVFKYAAAFAPKWTTTESKLKSYLPASLAYLSAFGAHVKKNPSWFVYAGSVRGVIPFSNVEVEHEFGDNDNALLQERSWDKVQSELSELELTKYIACNTISKINPFGHILWGNRTMHPIATGEGADVSEGRNYKKGLIASSFLNIRNLSTDIKKKLYETSRRYTFEPNTDVLWANFTSKIIPLLERMRSNQGVEGYEFERLVTTERATMKTILHIVPIEGVEDFDLTLSLEDSILTVSE